jgi:hypothetical protein
LQSIIKWGCVILVICTLSVLAGASESADFSRSANSFYEPEIIRMTGAIDYGDFERFKDKVREASRAIVILDSQGGKIGPAIAIAQYIKATGFMTYVENRSECISACSIIWLSGRRRFLEMGGIIGFHPPVRNDGSQTRTAPEIAHALLGWALGYLDVPEEVLMRIYDGDLISVKTYDSTKLSSIGIDFTSLPEQALSQTLKSTTEELSSFEFGITLGHLKGQTPEQGHFPLVEIVGENKYEELLRSGTATALTDTQTEEQTANIGFLEAVDGLDLLFKNTTSRSLKGIVLACTICRCNSSTSLVVLFQRTVSPTQLSRSAFSSAAVRQIDSEHGLERLSCFGVIATIN